jgi:hypothetical protein
VAVPVGQSNTERFPSRVTIASMEQLLTRSDVQAVIFGVLWSQFVFLPGTVCPVLWALNAVVHNAKCLTPVHLHGRVFSNSLIYFAQCHRTKKAPFEMGSPHGICKVTQRRAKSAHPTFLATCLCLRPNRLCLHPNRLRLRRQPLPRHPQVQTWTRNSPRAILMGSTVPK